MHQSRQKSEISCEKGGEGKVGGGSFRIKWHKSIRLRGVGGSLPFGEGG